MVHLTIFYLDIDLKIDRFVILYEKGFAHHDGDRGQGCQPGPDYEKVHL
jgi:hypothetical protein